MTDTKKVPDAMKLYDGMAKIHAGLCMLRSELGSEIDKGKLILQELEYQALIHMIELQEYYNVPHYHGERIEEGGLQG